MTTGRHETIFALASGRGGAIAMVRISGAATGSIIEGLLGRACPKPRQAAYRGLFDREGRLIDKGLILWFPAPGSYTGEDSAELQLHAGPAIIEAVLSTLAQAGARGAEPGEFTQRAFLTGRIDLIEAEGIADLIAAETEGQRRQALAQADGALSRIFAGWSERLRHILARQEALIDFPDETGSEGHDDAAAAEIVALATELGAHLEQARNAERLREGLLVVIAGAPNVGKSSLMNRLAERDIAIVTPMPGTTRDRLEAKLVFAGVPITLVDTAGLRDTDDPIETEGVRRARHAVGEADLVILVRTADTIETDDLQNDDGFLLVVNRVDEAAAPDGVLGVSATRGDNLPLLRERIVERVGALAGPREQPVATRARHRSHIEATRTALFAAIGQEVPELRSEDLRQALTSLGRLTGGVGVEDILDDIFSAFCIGK